MNTALWITTGLLTAVFLFSGPGKLFVPREKMAAMTDAARWVLDFKPCTLKAIGALEILGAVGLVLPAHSASRRSWCRWRPPAWP